MKTDIRHMSMLAALALLVGGLLSLFTIALATGCLPTTQTPADVAVLAGEAAELQACIDDAKASDGGLAFYYGCADAVKRHYHDGGSE